MEGLAADRHLWIHVGPPEARLSVSIIEPAGGATPRGTVLVLHGIYARGITMLPQALVMSKGRLSRGAGRSSRPWPIDWRISNLMASARPKTSPRLLMALERDGLIAGPIGVWGISYGATTAIHLAAYDSRVRAVVAVEPFSMVRPAIRQFGDIMAPEISIFVSDRQLRLAVDEAGEMAGFDPNNSDAVDAIASTSAPVLLNPWHERLACALLEQHLFEPVGKQRQSPDSNRRWRPRIALVRSEGRCIRTGDNVVQYMADRERIKSPSRFAFLFSSLSNMAVQARWAI